MSDWQKWLRRHTFAINALAFVLMIFSAALMYRAAQQGSQMEMIILLALFILGNVLILMVK